MNLLRSLSIAPLVALALASCGSSGGTPPLAAPGAVSYEGSGFDLEPGQPIAITPAVDVEGGSWSVTPALPAGLELDPQTGVITGTPSGFVLRSLHEVVVTNESGSASTWLNLRIGGEARFAYAASATDGAISEFGVEAAGGALFPLGWVGAGGAPPTPVGLAGIGADEDGEVLCVVDEFELLAFTMDPSTGRVTGGPDESLPVGDDPNRVSLGTGPHSLALHPAGTYVFVTTQDADRVRSYRVDQATGELTLVDEKATSAGPLEVACDPHGRFITVRHEYDATEGSEGTSLRSYYVVPGTGQLIQTSNLDLPEVETQALAYDPVGRNLYASATLPSGRVHQFGVDPVSGALTEVSAVAAGTQPGALRVSPSGRFVHLIDSASGSVRILAVDLGTGGLTGTGLSATGGTPEGLAFSFDGSELYVLDPTEQRIVVNSVDPASGALTSTSSLRTRAGTGALVQVAGELAVQRRTRSVVALSTVSADLRGYAMDDLTGALDPSGGSPVLLPDTPTGLAVDPQGRFAFVGTTGATEQLHAVALDAAGYPTSILTSYDSTYATGVMTIGPGGRYLFAHLTTVTPPLLASYAIADDGSLVAEGARELPDNPTEIAVDPTGSYLYVTVGGDGTTLLGEIRPFRINPTNGRLSELPVVPAAGFPASIAFSPSGERAYVTLRDADRIQTYDVGLDGSLTPVGTQSLTQNEPVDIVLTRDSRYAYATFEDTGNIGGLLLYDVKADTGELYNADTLAFQWRDSSAAGDRPGRVLVTPDGAFVHVLARNDEVLVAFRTDPTGIPTFLELEGTGVGPVDMGHVTVLE